MINSLNKKIALIFISLGFFLLCILLVQIIPNMNKEQEVYTKKHIDNIIYLTTQQLKLAKKSLYQESINREEYYKSIVEVKIENLESKIGVASTTEINTYIKKIEKELNANIFIVDENQNVLESSPTQKVNLQKIINKGWSKESSTKPTVCPSRSNEVFYLKELSNSKNKILLVFNVNKLHQQYISFERKLKQDIQNSFLLNEDMHKGKVYLMWLNKNDLKNSNDPLYNKNDDPYYNNKYCISRTSNIKFPLTGNLTGKQIFDAIDKEPIRHLLASNAKDDSPDTETFTWVRSLGESSNGKLLYITSVYVEDFDNKISSSFWKILPPTFFSFLVAIILGILMTRRVFKSINILSKTAHLVKQGDISVRSNIKGLDDVGVLGTTFDNMLDTIEKDIKVLDKKVEDRTSQLQSSLDEKEILLKEIHHRVKNNLAMTIELIKIQKIKLKDPITKIALGDIQERIYVMELLHRKLYESKNLSSINIPKYINELVDDISHSYIEDKSIHIVVNIDQEYFMDIDHALPCGLIINECLTNSLKHAFKGNDGKIKISLVKDDEYFILKIEDNGVGIDKNINIQTSKTLGLRLISSIVRGQLLGTIEYETKNGACFIIKFKF
jgi:two-component sensor histidine kinase